MESVKFDWVHTIFMNWLHLPVEIFLEKKKHERDTHRKDRETEYNYAWAQVNKM